MRTQKIYKFLFVILSLVIFPSLSHSQEFSLYAGAHSCGGNGIDTGVTVNSEPFSSIPFGPVEVTLPTGDSVEVAPLAMDPITVNGSDDSGEINQQELDLIHLCDEHISHYLFFKIVFYPYLYGTKVVLLGQCKGYGNSEEFVFATADTVISAVNNDGQFPPELYCIK